MSLINPLEKLSYFSRLIWKQVLCFSSFDYGNHARAAWRIYPSRNYYTPSQRSCHCSIAVRGEGEALGRKSASSSSSKNAIPSSSEDCLVRLDAESSSKFFCAVRDRQPKLHQSMIWLLSAASKGWEEYAVSLWFVQKFCEQIFGYSVKAMYAYALCYVNIYSAERCNRRRIRFHGLYVSPP